MKTPRYVSRTITAGSYASIGVRGKYLMVVSISASTIHLGFDDETPQQVLQGLALVMPDDYKQLRLFNAGAATSTVVLYVADNPLDLLTSAVLAAIQTLLTPGTTLTPIADVTLAATGGAGTLIVAANTARKAVVVFADEDNTGDVFLGPTNAVSDANKIGMLTATGSWRETYTGALYGVGNDAAQVVCGYQLS